MKEILTKDGKRLTLFEDKVVVNKKLPKWFRAEEGLSKTEVPNEKSSINTNRNDSIRGFFIDDPDVLPIRSSNDIDSDVDAGTRWLPLYEVAEGISFDDLAKSGIKDLTRLIAENKLKFVIGGYGSFGNTQGTLLSGNIYADSVVGSVSDKHSGFNFLNKFKDKFNEFIGKRRKDNTITIDALEFFSYVKLSAKESVLTYRDRVSDYLKEVHNAVTVGQTALMEDLLRGLITNKYESVLFAEGLYYVVNEETMVSFVKQCENGIKLDYIKNFTRPLPQYVVDKVDRVNQLEVFDNYVVLYYDPDGKIYKETAKEEAKRKDPILFGVIAGSNKLYYIADWTDEYCDLTLEKFIDVVGIKKDELHMDYGTPRFNNEETKNEDNKTSKKKKYKVKRRKNKLNKKEENKD